jgi:hypothetical protein
MALIANFIVSATEIRRPWLVGCAWLLLVAELSDPDRPSWFRESRARITLLRRPRLQPDPVRRLLFGSAIKRSTSLARDYGTNLLGAMLGGVGMPVAGDRLPVLLFLIAACYVGALLARGRERGASRVLELLESR